MSDLKVVLYKENLAPRTLAIDTKTVYRTLYLCAFFALLLLFTIGLTLKFYMRSKNKGSQVVFSQVASDIAGPTNSPLEQIEALKDEVERLNAKIKNDATAQNAPKELETSSPALALFAPGIVDKTANQQQVMAQNFKYYPGKNKVPSSLSFELHNNQQTESAIQKGYIVVLAKSGNLLQSYPDSFNTNGTFLVDYQKGETFQVARFRMVNAQFPITGDIERFQILIFTRNGELLVNTSYQVTDND